MLIFIGRSRSINAHSSDFELMQRIHTPLSLSWLNLYSFLKYILSQTSLALLENYSKYKLALIPSLFNLCYRWRWVHVSLKDGWEMKLETTDAHKSLAAPSTPISFHQDSWTNFWYSSFVASKLSVIVLRVVGWVLSVTGCYWMPFLCMSLCRIDLLNNVWGGVLP